MTAAFLSPGFADHARQSARAFRLALTALSRPGRIETVTGPMAPAPLSTAAATLLLILCDRDTPLHLAQSHDVPEVRDWVTFHTGAPLVPPEMAQFGLGRWEALQADRFPIGQPDYPDRSATLIDECDRLEAKGARLTGPGIAESAALSLPQSDLFRANAALFPLGLDFFFTCGADLAALPRTTRVEEV